MMNQEGKRLVALSDELEFTRTYRELMQIRYPEGLVILDRMRPTDLTGYTVPCTLQLLVENAIKHNAIAPDKPLVITVTSDRQSITLTNNRIPKLTPSRNSGIGLQYIRNQFRDIAGKEIFITETEDSFSVTIPILREGVEETNHEGIDY